MPVSLDAAENFEGRRIGLVGATVAGPYARLLEGLAALEPVRFVDCSEPCDAALIVNGDLSAARAHAVAGRPVFVARAGGQALDRPASEVIFSRSARVDVCLQGRTLVATFANGTPALAPEPGDEVLATAGGQPLWLVRPVGSVACHLVTVDLPVVPESAYLMQLFDGLHFAEFVPLIHFLREVAGGAGWSVPSRQACFVFDDPSLYWRSYGFLNFLALGEHAARHHYHAAVATIPLDTWWVSRAVAETLRAHPREISLLIHGNNHNRQELLSRENRSRQLSISAQALRRMDRLTRRHRLRFSPVMEPPHGALAAEMCEPLLALGYRGALSSPDLLLHYNPGQRWPVQVGLEPATLSPDGLPILPRIRMSRTWGNEVLLAAFMRRPIILAGHHQDAAHEMRALTEFANLVNSFPGVEWARPDEILGRNFLQRRSDGTLVVRAFSRHIEIRIPPGVERLRIERPWIRPTAQEPIELLPTPGLVAAAGPVAEFAVAPDSAITVASPARAPAAGSENLNPLPLWPIARKAVMEIRDRLTPLLPFLDRLRRDTSNIPW